MLRMSQLKSKIFSLLAALLLSIPIVGQEQERAGYIIRQSPAFLTLKTNLIYDATATFNLGFEVRLSKKFSLDVPFNYNPFTFSEGMQWRHFMVQPEVRLWTNETFQGHFFGVHGHYGVFNIGNLPNPPFSTYMHDHRFEGSFSGGGLSYGHKWHSRGWGLEITIGVGYIYRAYDRFHRDDKDTKIDEAKRHFVGPDKLGLSLTYTFGGKKTKAKIVQTIDKPLYIGATETEVEKPAALVVTGARTFVNKGKAYIDYFEGQSSIEPSIGKNVEELKNIATDVVKVGNNPSWVLTGIKLIGYCSPEGDSAENLHLTAQRAESLKQHIGLFWPLPDSSFTVVGGGEDWDLLERLVRDSDLPDKEEILRIIHETSDFDEREEQLSLLAEGEVYRQLKQSFFPLLRRTEYEIEYKERISVE